MAPRLGAILFLMAAIVAGLIVAWVVWGYVSGLSNGEPIIRIVPLIFAGAILLLGWACRSTRNR
jgi:hypothetical protein